ncbi:Dynein light chain 1 [Diplonema papillatum]|nr:Dynein light chain 1 [Diplonema papillatum]
MAEKKDKELAEKKVVVLDAYMAEEEQQLVIDFAQQGQQLTGAQGQLPTERDVSMHIKKEADKKLGPGRWHCAYGKAFGAFVTYESMKFIRFQLGQHHVLLWKHG